MAKVGPLRQRMIEDMTIRNLSRSTQQSMAIVGRRCSAWREAMAVVGPEETAFGREGCGALVKGGGADPAQRAQLGERQWAVDVGERQGDAVVDGTWRGRLRCAPIDHLERQGVGALRELERDGGHRREKFSTVASALILLRFLVAEEGFEPPTHGL
jgi:hypothetical protein